MRSNKKLLNRGYTKDLIEGREPVYKKGVKGFLDGDGNWASEENLKKYNKKKLSSKRKSSAIEEFKIGGKMILKFGDGDKLKDIISLYTNQTGARNNKDQIIPSNTSSNITINGRTVWNPIMIGNGSGIYAVIDPSNYNNYDYVKVNSNQIRSYNVWDNANAFNQIYKLKPPQKIKLLSTQLSKSSLLSKPSVIELPPVRIVAKKNSEQVITKNDLENKNIQVVNLNKGTTKTTATKQDLDKLPNGATVYINSDKDNLTDASQGSLDGTLIGTNQTSEDSKFRSPDGSSDGVMRENHDSRLYSEDGTTSKYIPGTSNLTDEELIDLINRQEAAENHWTNYLRFKLPNYSTENINYNPKLLAFTMNPYWRNTLGQFGNVLDFLDASTWMKAGDDLISPDSKPFDEKTLKMADLLQTSLSFATPSLSFLAPAKFFKALKVKNIGDDISKIKEFKTALTIRLGKFKSKSVMEKLEDFSNKVNKLDETINTSTGRPSILHPRNLKTWKKLHKQDISEQLEDVKNSYNALHLAISTNRSPSIKEIISEGGLVKTVNSEGKSKLYYPGSLVQGMRSNYPNKSKAMYTGIGLLTALGALGGYGLLKPDENKDASVLTRFVLKNSHNASDSDNDNTTLTPELQDSITNFFENRE